MLFHIADRHRWMESLDAGEYTASTRGAELAEIGFIHLCTAEQLHGVAERFYRGATDLVLLHVDEARLAAPLEYEPVGGTGERFPHLYGPLNVDAVVQVDDPFAA